MTSRDFCYWLQGFMELAMATDGPNGLPVRPFLNDKQMKIVQNHLNMVFVHEIDPSFGNAQKQKELNDAHDPKKLEETKVIFPTNNVNEILLRC